MLDVPIVQQGAKKPRAEHRVWASEEFRWFMYGKRLPCKIRDPCPKKYFRAALDRVAPLWSELLGDRYNWASVLEARKNVLDLAFVEIVWRYSHAVGREVFPEGLHCWPEPDRAPWREAPLPPPAAGPPVGSQPVSGQ